MPRKLVLYIASSVNGKIATSDGGVQWLEEIPNPEKSDYGYEDFYISMGATLQGYATYAQVKAWDIPFPYPKTMNYVLTRKTDLEQDENVVFINSNQLETIKNLKAEDGKDIWLIGGGQIVTWLLNEGMIDEIRLFQMPILLEGGINLFEEITAQIALELAQTKTYQSGVVELRYLIKG